MTKMADRHKPRQVEGQPAYCGFCLERWPCSAIELAPPMADQGWEQVAAEADALCSAATPGPWEAGGNIECHDEGQNCWHAFGACVITGAPGENPDDCTTHAHEGPPVDCTDTHNRALAARGLKSYRCRGQFGWIMIGATDDADALREALRSAATVGDLEIWNGSAYVPVAKAGHATP